MALSLSHALAAPFDWTTAGGGAYDLVLTFASGPSPVNVSFVSGTYRMLLAPTSGSVQDFVRQVEDAINSVMFADGRAETFTLTYSTTTGKLTLAISSGTFTCAFGSYTAAALLGFTTTRTAVATAEADYPPKYLATFVARTGGDFVEREPVAARETVAGGQAGWRSGITTFVDEVAFQAIPTDPSYQGSYAQTPWGSTNRATTRGAGHHPFTCSDLLAVSLGKAVAFADGNFAECLADTSERYYLCTIPVESQRAPRVALMADGYLGLKTWTTKLVLRSTPTGTRA